MIQSLRLIPFMLVLFLSSSNATAQQRHVFSEESTLTIDGTSNQSDWSVTANEIDGWLEYNDTDEESAGISALELIVTVSRMKGGKSPIMDRLMYRTLKSDEFKEITFVLSSTEHRSDSGVDGQVLHATGDLTIAGTTNHVELEVIVENNGEGGTVYAGSYDMKMTDFGMKPPTALFGALHTRDDIVIHFEMIVDSD